MPEEMIMYSDQVEVYGALFLAYHNGVPMLLACYLFLRASNLRTKFSTALAVCWGTLLAYITAVSVFNEYIRLSVLSISQCVLFILLLVVFSSGKWLRRIGNALLCMALFFAATIIAVAFTTAFGIDTTSYLGMIAEEIFIVAALVCIFALYISIKNKNIRHLRFSGDKLPYLLFPLSQLTLFTASAYLVGSVAYGGETLTLNTPAGIATIILGVGSVIALVANYFMLREMIKTSENAQLKEELKFRDYADKLNLEYYESLIKDA